MPAIHLLKTPLFVFVIAASLLISACSLIPGNGVQDEFAAAPFPEKPNIIVILTDDQHFKTIEYMPILQDRLVQRGIVFDNAIASIPECCPFRASFLAGGFYPKNTNVKGNRYPAKFFNDETTLSTILSDEGYATGFIGKYKHGYQPGEVPPGWSSFVANNNGGMIRDWFSLKDITYGSSVGDITDKRLVRLHDQYLTYFHRDEALRFIKENAGHPFFLLVSTYAPHVPATPPQDESLSVEDFDWDEFYQSDLSEKPQWVEELHAANTRKNYSQLAKRQLLALQAVDRMIGEIDDLLRDLDLDDNTVFVFTSDNGITLGEHDLPADKGYPYEPSLRVPLIIRTPNIMPRRDQSLVAVNLDLPATIFDAAGIRTESDGVSLLPLIAHKKRLARDAVLIENYGYLAWRKFGKYPVWSGFRTPRWKYVESVGDRTELYDLKNDPAETVNLAYDDSYRRKVKSFASKLAQERSLSFTTFAPPTGKVGQAYKYQLTSAWSEPPYRYDVVGQSLPPGLQLDETTGLVSGTPTEPFNGRVMIRVQSTRIATQNLQPEHAIWQFIFKISE